MFSVYETFMSDGHLWIARSLTCVPPIPPGGCRVHLRNARFAARNRRRSWLTVVVLPFHDQVTLSSWLAIILLQYVITHFLSTNEPRNFITLKIKLNTTTTTTTNTPRDDARHEFGEFVCFLNQL